MRARLVAKDKWAHKSDIRRDARPARRRAFVCARQPAEQ